MKTGDLCIFNPPGKDTHVLWWVHETKLGKYKHLYTAVQNGFKTYLSREAFRGHLAECVSAADDVFWFPADHVYTVMPHYWFALFNIK